MGLFALMTGNIRVGFPDVSNFSFTKKTGSLRFDNGYNNMALMVEW